MAPAATIAHYYTQPYFASHSSKCKIKILEPISESAAVPIKYLHTTVHIEDLEKLTALCVPPRPQNKSVDRYL